MFRVVPHRSGEMTGPALPSGEGDAGDGMKPAPAAVEQVVKSS